MKLRTDDLNTQVENKEERVINIEENQSVANNARKNINPIPIATIIAVAILTTSCSVYEISKKVREKASNKEELPIIYLEADEENNINENVQKTTLNNNNAISEYEVDYSNVNTFYKHIIENRNNYGIFAESFQTEDDVKNLVSFIYSFDPLYSNQNLNTSINSREEFDEIISDYYSSCVSHDIKGQMYLLYPKDSMLSKLLKESEELAYDLKNGSGNDYSFSNKYDTWMIYNITDGRTNINQTSKNAPLIETLRWQFEQYRYVGNRLNARKYQKNDSLPVPGVDVYYSEFNNYEGEISETQNSFTCPDWGVDNVMSPTEEVTETDLVVEMDNERLFEQVEEIFNNKLKGKTK